MMVARLGNSEGGGLWTRMTVTHWGADDEVCTGTRNHGCSRGQGRWSMQEGSGDGSRVEDGTVGAASTGEGTVKRRQAGTMEARGTN